MLNQTCWVAIHPQSLSDMCLLSGTIDQGERERASTDKQCPNHRHRVAEWVCWDEKWRCLFWGFVSTSMYCTYKYAKTSRHVHIHVHIHVHVSQIAAVKYQRQVILHIITYCTCALYMYVGPNTSLTYR